MVVVMVMVVEMGHDITVKVKEGRKKKRKKERKEGRKQGNED